MPVRINRIRANRLQSATGERIAYHRRKQVGREPFATSRQNGKTEGFIAGLRLAAEPQCIEVIRGYANLVRRIGDPYRNGEKAERWVLEALQEHDRRQIRPLDQNKAVLVFKARQAVGKVPFLRRFVGEFTEIAG